MLSLLASLGRPRPSDQLATGGPLGLLEFLATLRAGLEEHPGSPRARAEGEQPQGGGPPRRPWGNRALLIHAGEWSVLCD